MQNNREKSQENYFFLFKNFVKSLVSLDKNLVKSLDKAK